MSKDDVYVASNRMATLWIVTYKENDDVIEFDCGEDPKLAQNAAERCVQQHSECFLAMRTTEVTHLISDDKCKELLSFLN